jgi:hypothetical protein
MTITYEKTIYSGEEVHEEFDWKTWRELYVVRRGLKPSGVYDARFALTFLAVCATTFDFVLEAMVPLFDVRRLGLRNGYILTLLGPFILAYWIILFAAWLFFEILMSPLFPLSLLWALFMELPADAINDSFNARKRIKIEKVLIDKRRKKKAKD